MADTTIMRRNNLQLVLDAIADNDCITASELVKETGLSVATISRVITQLRAKGLVMQTRKTDTEVGRKPEVCRICGTYGSSLYLNLKSGCLQGFLLDFSGEVIGRAEYPVGPDLTVDGFLQMALQLREFLTCGNAGRLLAVCLSVPGQLDQRTGTVCRIPNFPGFERAALQSRMEEAMGVPCLIRNTARLTAWGCHQSHRQENDSLIYVDITADGGIGAGLVINGRLYEDHAGLVGEMGDMIVSIRAYGKQEIQTRGALELEAGLNTVLHKCADLLEQSRLPSLSRLEELSCSDSRIAAVLENATRAWAAAIVNLVAVLSPDEVVLGGDLSEENRQIHAMIRRHLSELYYRDIRFRMAEPDSQYHVRGAAQVSRTRLFGDALDEISG